MAEIQKFKPKNYYYKEYKPYNKQMLSSLLNDIELTDNVNYFDVYDDFERDVQPNLVIDTLKFRNYRNRRYQRLLQILKTALIIINIDCSGSILTDQECCDILDNMEKKDYYFKVQFKEKIIFSLNLSDNALGDRYANLFLESNLLDEAKTRNLKFNVDLSSNYITDVSARRFIDVLENYSENLTIKLEENSLTSETVKKELKVQRSRIVDNVVPHLIWQEKLRWLISTKTKLSMPWSDHEIKYLCAYTKKDIYLQRINLDKSRVNTRGARYLEQFLKSNKRLQVITLWDNYIGGVGAKHIANGVIYNPRLATVELGNNNFEADGAFSIANIIIMNDTLDTLNMGNSFLNMYDLKLISHALRYSENLVYVSFLGNFLTGKSFEFLCKGVAYNQSIRILILDHNRIEDSDCEHLEFLLTKNKTIESLHLDHNLIQYKGFKKVATGIKNNQSVRFFSMTHNRLMIKFLYDFEDKLKENLYISELYLNGQSEIDIWEDRKQIRRFRRKMRDHKISQKHKNPNLKHFICRFFFNLDKDKNKQF